MAAHLLSSCVYQWDAGEVARSLKAHQRAAPESEWNGARIWKRVSDNPPTYVPNGYSSGGATPDSPGEWFEDERDGKRFFVPSAGVEGLSVSVLRRDAIKNSTPFKATPKVSRGFFSSGLR